MNDSSRGGYLFVIYLVVSFILSFVIPSRTTLKLRSFVKFIYYFPYAKSEEAIQNLEKFPGKLFKIARCFKENQKLKKEISTLSLEKQILSTRVKELEDIVFLKDEKFFEPGNFNVTTPYGTVDLNSGILLIRGEFKEGSPVVVRVSDDWVLLGKIKKAKGGISQCLLTSNKTSRVAVVSEKRDFWGVLVGLRDGLATIEFIWPSVGVDVKKGEKIFTSGWDGIFPEGILCGRVRDFKRSKIGEMWIDVTLGYNLNSIKNVFVIER